MGYVLLLLLVLIVLSTGNYKNKNLPNNPKVNKGLKEIFPIFNEDDIIVIGVKSITFGSNEVDILQISKLHCHKLVNDYRMLKYIENTKDLIRMINYQGYLHKKIRRELNKFIELNALSNKIEELKTKITIN